MTDTPPARQPEASTEATATAAAAVATAVSRAATTEWLVPTGLLALHVMALDHLRQHHQDMLDMYTDTVPAAAGVDLMRSSDTANGPGPTIRRLWGDVVDIRSQAQHWAHR